jgi:hypothetical protein
LVERRKRIHGMRGGTDALLFTHFERGPFMSEGTVRKSKRQSIPETLRLASQGLRPALALLARPATLAQLPRLLVEGYAPVRRMFIQAHNGREITRLLSQGNQVTFVSSFARSGNTWVRYLLSDVFLQNHGIETATELAVHPDEIIPDFYCEVVARRNTAVPTPGLMVKTHDLFPHLKRQFGDPVAQAPGGKCRHLYIYRTPEDSLVSFYHLQLREKYVKSGAGMDIDAFCLNNAVQWVAHVSSYLAARESGAAVFFASYDQLLQSPEAILVEMLDWLGVRHTSSVVMRAVQNMRFANLKALEARDSAAKPPVFRQGSNGSGSRELKAATVSEIRRATDHLLAQASDCVARQRARNGAIAKPFNSEAVPGAASRNGRVDLLEAAPRVTSV